MNFKLYHNFINESYSSASLKDIIGLLEGGLAGHINHLFDDKDMTFAELKQMISDVFSGNVEITAKTDGQNLSVTYKDGKVGLARNKESFINPMSVKDTAAKFDGRGNIKDAFVNSLSAIESALKKVNKKKLEEWFQNGKRFMSMEIIYPPTKNVIDYGGRCLLMIHNLSTYDEEGNKIEEDPSAAKEIFSVLQKAGATNEGEFEITGPQVLSIHNTVAAEKELKNISKQIDSFVKEHGLTLSNTIGDYVTKAFIDAMDKAFEGLPELPEELRETLINRFANGDKSVNKRNLIKMVSAAGIDKDKFIKAFESIDKNVGSIYSNAMLPLEIMIFKSGAIFLKCLTGFVSANPNETVNKLKKELEDTIAEIESNPETSDRLIKQIEKLNAIGMDNIVPEEGIVFKHHDKVFKITGAFAPINQILGWLKYKR